MVLWTVDGQAHPQAGNSKSEALNPCCVVCDPRSAWYGIPTASVSASVEGAEGRKTAQLVNISNMLLLV